MLIPPAALEALLFASGEPMEKSLLAKLLEINEDDVQVVIDALEKALRGRGLAVVDNGKEVELRTSAEASLIVKKLRDSELSRDLGKAGLETLAVIAYRTGSTRSEIDWVRGVNSSTSVRTLLVRGLIEGEEDAKDRRKIRYRVTTDALAHLGAKNVEELPRYAELSKEAAVVATEESKASE